MKNEFKDVWKNLLSKKVYIYGAQYSAGYLYDLLDSIGKANQVIGFVVSDVSKDQKVYRGLDVVAVEKILDKESRILVPNVGEFLEEIKESLVRLEFLDVHYVSKLMVMSEFENNPLLIQERDWYKKNRVENFNNDSKVRREICEILAEGQPRFGALEPYQSLKELGIIGKRPTEYRIEKYGLLNILTKEMNVLDIGCNTAFIDFSVAKRVHSISGIEHESSFVAIADIVRKYLEIDNVDIWSGEFKDWIKENEGKKYEMIFSFAIHRWLGLTPVEYVAVINRYLSQNGYVCFESHVGEIDMEYEQCVAEMKKIGFQIIKSDTIDDSRDGVRKFVVAQK